MYNIFHCCKRKFLSSFLKFRHVHDFPIFSSQNSNKIPETSVRDLTNSTKVMCIGISLVYNFNVYIEIHVTDKMNNISFLFKLWKLHLRFITAISVEPTKRTEEMRI